MANNEVRHVLCRRIVSDVGEPDRYCAKPIKVFGSANRLEWCPDCRARLPFWPTDDPKPYVNSDNAVTAATTS